MPPSPHPSTVRAANRRRRVVQATLAAILLVGTLVAVRIGTDSTDSAAHGNSIEAKTTWGKGKQKKHSNRSSHLIKGAKAKQWSQNGWTKAGTRTKKNADSKGSKTTKHKAKDEAKDKSPGTGGTSESKTPSATPGNGTDESPTVTPARPTEPSGPSTPTPPSGGHGLQVDVATLPDHVAGATSHRIGTAGYQPRRNDGVGAFRINCFMSHMAYDDPIVAPGRPGGSHLHSFFGNDSIDAYSSSATVANSGGSTCTGGTANRSGYWVPSMIDTRTQRAVQPWREAGVP